MMLLQSAADPHDFEVHLASVRDVATATDLASLAEELRHVSF